MIYARSGSPILYAGLGCGCLPVGPARFGQWQRLRAEWPSQGPGDQERADPSMASGTGRTARDTSTCGSTGLADRSAVRSPFRRSPDHTGIRRRGNRTCTGRYQDGCSNARPLSLVVFPPEHQPLAVLVLGLVPLAAFGVQEGPALYPDLEWRIDLVVSP